MKMKNLIIGFLVIGILSSCVSKQKYAESAALNAMLSKKNGEYERHNKELEQVLEELANEFNAYKLETAEKVLDLEKELEATGSELDDKDKALQSRAKRLLALEGQFKKQQEAVNSLKKTMADALVNFDTDELSVEVRNGKVYVSLSHKLLFPSASAALNEEGKEAIGKVAEVLKNNPQINIEVIGHTDNQPIRIKYANNWELSAARSITITKLLTDNYEIEGNRITASGMGEYRPIADNETPEGRAKNRRTEIVLTPKLDKLMEILSSEN